MLSRALGIVGRAVLAASHSGQAQQAAAAVATSAANQQFVSRGFATNSTDVFNIHKDTPENNVNTKFEFTPVSAVV